MRVCNQNPSRRSSVLLSQNPNVYPFCQKQTLVFGGVGHPQSLSLNAAADRGLYTSPLSRRVGSRGGSALEASRGRRAGRQPGRTRALQVEYSVFQFCSPGKGGLPLVWGWPLHLNSLHRGKYCPTICDLLTSLGANVQNLSQNNLC